MKINRTYKKEIESKLRSVIRKYNIVNALKGLSITLIGVGLLFFIFNIAELLGRFNADVRTVLISILLIGLLAATITLILIPLFRNFPLLTKINYPNTATVVGNHFPEIKDDLKNALQLVENKNQYFSEELVDGAFKKVYDKTTRIQFEKSVDSSFLRNYYRNAIIVLGLILIFIFVVPGLNASAFRLLSFSEEFIIPTKFNLIIQPGNQTLTKGEDVRIKVNALGEAPDFVYLLSKSEEQTDFEEIKLQPDSNGFFIKNIPAVKKSFEYYAYAENVQSNIYKIEMIDRPIISEFKVKITPPPYAKLPPIVQKDNGNINTLKGSSVFISLKASKILDSAFIKFSDNETKEFTIDETGIETSFRVFNNLNYSISLIDTETIRNSNPITYTINVKEDEYPSIKMISPYKDIKLGEDDRVSLVTNIFDDFGFSGLVLNYRLSASRYERPQEQFTKVEIPINRNIVEDDVYYVWNLVPLFLATDDVISYYLEIFDNDNVSGPKSARTEIYKLRVPSLDELFAEADELQETSKEELIETLEEAQKLKEEIENISNELKQDDKEITFEEKEKIEDAVEKFKELENKVEDIQESLSQMQQELQENNLLSEETMEKYLELQELMDQLTSDEMKEAFERMREMLQQISRENVQQAFEDIKMNEDAFQKSLERTINLLKRLQIEQKVEELKKRTEDLSENVNENLENTDKSNLSDEQQREELAERQEETSDKLKQLEEEMQKLKEKMSELNDMPIDELQKMMDEFEKQNNEQLSEQTQQQLMQQQQNQAMQNMQQMSQNMQDMQSMMEQLQQAMQQQNQMQVLNDMMKILDNLLTLSKEQEKLKSETQQLGSNSPQFNDSAQKQDEIRRNLSKVLQQMAELSQKTFAISPEMGKALGKAHSEMSQSISSLQGKNGAVAFQKQNGAMKSLNEAAALTQGAMNQMMQGGQGGGMMSMMQQLQQLSQQQMGLNQMTKMLQQGNLSQQQMAQLQRLSQEQQLIQKSLQQLNKESKESGQSKKLTSNLEKIVEEMQEVISGMNTQKLDDKLIQAQERILSKLLDAQRSINERDFEKKRESTAGTNIARESPPELLLSTKEGQEKLRDELLKAIREGYAKDYEDLIRKYFEALQKQEINN